MNEILVLLEISRSFAMVILYAIFAVSMGLIIFDHPPGKNARIEDAALPPERRAA
jgi:hypothetical protein